MGGGGGGPVPPATRAALFSAGPSFCSIGLGLALLGLRRGGEGRAGGAGGLSVCVSPPRLRLAEKKASIGYTYEDSTVAELENSAERRGEEDDSEEDSNTDEDEVIPDIGEDGLGGGGGLCQCCAGAGRGELRACPLPPPRRPQMWRWTWTSSTRSKWLTSTSRRPPTAWPRATSSGTVLGEAGGTPRGLPPSLGRVLPGGFFFGGGLKDVAEGQGGGGSD